MFDKIRKKKIEKLDAAVDDSNLSEEDIREMQEWPAEDFENPAKIKKQLAKRRKRRKVKDPIVRVDDLERIMKEHGEDIDPEAIVSMYMPRRKFRRIGSALLRLDKIRIIVLILLLLIAFFFVIAFSQEKMGNFTVNLDRLELYRKGMAIADTGEFLNPTARLEAEAIEDANNITITDLPANIDDIEGSHNGRNYLAYTYYVRNSGKESVNYVAKVKLTNASKGAEYAARVVVYRNGKKEVYAEPTESGKAEPGTKKFVNHNTAYRKKVKDFQVGYVDKYTVVVFLEGNDPQCVDNIIGGSLQFEMKIDALDKENTTLFSKFIQDIKDTISGDKPIGVSGTKAPKGYNSENVTWGNRRNK